ncbi:protein kinase [Cohnella sp.]|uniref:serine/threonine-protein kinase n=1 Tax=Cohnella sp. TaxID=1883426 RepID=UPI0035698FE7
MERMYDLDIILNGEYELNSQKFRITELLGSGGIGVIYAASNVANDHKICVKVLNPRKEYAPHFEQIVERFYHEATRGKEFKHPNVVNIYDITTINGFHCYSMEYCGHKTLKELIRSQHDLQLSDKIDIFFQICSGLNYIHQVGVHRDLKPDNILISNLEFRNITIKISDFGTFFDISDISKNPETQIQDRFGSLAYISPEQRQGKKLNCQTDIYALGLIFYQLLINDTYEIRLNQQKYGVYLDYNDKLLLQNIIGRMCENDLKFRYESVNDILLDFKPLIKKGRWDFEKIQFPEWVRERDIIVNTEYCSSNLINEINLDKITFKGELWSFDLFDVLKEYQVETEDFSKPTEVVIKNQVVVVGWSTGYATAVSLMRGTMSWCKKISENPIISTPIIYKDKCIFVDEVGKIICVHLYTGNLIWEENINKECTSPLKMWGDLLFLTTNENMILLYNIDKREIIKEVEIEYNHLKKEDNVKYVEINMLMQHKNNLYVCFGDHIKIFKDIVNSNKIMHVFLPTVTYRYSNFSEYFVGFTIDDKNIYATASNGAVCCSDIESGSLIWEIETAEFPSLPYSYKGYICFTTDAGYLYMCDKRTGATLKKVEIDHHYNEKIKGVLPIISDNQILYFSELEIKVIDFNYFEKIKSLYSWSTTHCKIPFSIEFKPPVFVSNIMVFSGDDGIYAFDFDKK